MWMLYNLWSIFTNSGGLEPLMPIVKQLIRWDEYFVSWWQQVCALQQEVVFFSVPGWAAFNTCESRWTPWSGDRCWPTITPGWWSLIPPKVVGSRPLLPAVEFKSPVHRTTKRLETGLDWTGRNRTAVASCLLLRMMKKTSCNQLQPHYVRNTYMV